jgi:hypothetical protein
MWQQIKSTKNEQRFSTKQKNVSETGNISQK